MKDDELIARFYDRYADKIEKSIQEQGFDTKYVIGLIDLHDLEEYTAAMCCHLPIIQWVYDTEQERFTSLGGIAINPLTFG